MKKSDLKTGMRCEIGDDMLYIIYEGEDCVYLIDKHAFTLKLSGDDLISEGGSRIDKVYSSPSIEHKVFSYRHKGELLWEYKEEVEMTMEQICKELGRTVKIIK